MELRELRLEQVPGLPAPLKLEGKPGLNLILGPNGSGKSTLTRSALGLLWPDESDRGHLSAVWRHGDATWHAARAGGQAVVWQREGQPHPPPALPHPDQATSFRLGLLDLLKLEADPSDQGLARAIRNQMAGGFDLGALAPARTVTGAEGRNEARDLARAEEQVRTLRIRQRTLQEDEARLARLNDQLQAAQAAAARAEALSQAGLAAAAQASAQTAATELAANFPPLVEVLDLPISGTNIAFATNFTTIRTVSNHPPLKLVHVDCVWSFQTGAVFTNSLTTYRAPDQ